MSIQLLISTEGELLRVVQEFGVDPNEWLKPPHLLVKEFEEGDAYAEVGDYGLGIVRQAALLDVHHLTDDFQWYQMEEDFQLIRQPDGKFLKVSRKRELQGKLRETVRNGNFEKAVYDCLTQEVGLKRVLPDLIRWESDTPDFIDCKDSTLFKGVKSIRRIRKGSYPVPIDDFDILGNYEYDEARGVFSSFQYHLVGRKGRERTERAAS